jgi:chromosome segregation ATPase
MINGHWTSEVESSGGDSPYLDTVALLQEEIARLEEELRLRDELGASGAGGPGAADPVGERAIAGRVDELTAELAKRDETIALMYEQIRLLEEGETATRAESAQIEGWLRSVDTSGDATLPEARDYLGELEDLRRGAEMHQREADEQRKLWESQRRSLELEIEQLRSNLDKAAQQVKAAAQQAKAATEKAQTVDPSVVAVMERENQILRETCAELNRSKLGLSTEMESIREEMNSLRSQLFETEGELCRVLEAHEKERQEYEAALASLKSEGARGHSPVRPNPLADAVQDPSAAEGGDPYSNMSAEERMYAFRKHLQEVHQREVEEQRNKRLTVRLARLLSRSNPSS